MTRGTRGIVALAALALATALTAPAATAVIHVPRSSPAAAPPKVDHSITIEQPPSSPLSSVAAPPASIRIPSIGVSAPVVQLALGADGSVPTPSDPATTGWVTASPAPGAMGPSVIIGHLDSYSGPAVFWRLGQLQPGTVVTIQRADGSTVDFAVSRVVRYPADGFPDTEVYGATAGPELRLISCIGSWDIARRQYRERIVVFASLAP